MHTCLECTFILLASQDKSLQDMTIEELKGQGGKNTKQTVCIAGPANQTIACC